MTFAAGLDLTGSVFGFAGSVLLAWNVLEEGKRATALKQVLRLLALHEKGAAAGETFAPFVCPFDKSIIIESAEDYIRCLAKQQSWRGWVGFVLLTLGFLASAVSKFIAP
jgi:hypothetical protein